MWMAWSQANLLQRAVCQFLLHRLWWRLGLHFVSPHYLHPSILSQPRFQHRQSIAYNMTDRQWVRWSHQPPRKRRFPKSQLILSGYSVMSSPILKPNNAYLMALCAVCGPQHSKSDENNVPGSQLTCDIRFLASCQPHRLAAVVSTTKSCVDSASYSRWIVAMIN